MAKHGPKHVNNVLGTLKTTLGAARKLGLIAKVPEVELLKAPKSDRPFYDFDAYADLVKAAEKVNRETLLVVLLGAEAGLRIGETVALEQTDIDYRRGVVTIQRNEYKGEVQKTPKGGRIRRVPLTKRLLEALTQHRHLKGSRVFQDPENGNPTARVMQGWLRAAERRAGLEVSGNTHRLRHTFCSHLAMRGAPARAIQELAGHADLQTTLTYMHLSPSATAPSVYWRADPLETFWRRQEGRRKAEIVSAT
jgi:integrase